VIRWAVHNWRQDSEFAGIRDQAVLAKLPEEERAMATAFWSDIAAWLKKAEAKTK
jgi:hypothetical protein